MKESKSILFNNGQAIEDKKAALIVDGRSQLTPRAYNLLNILSKRLMNRILKTTKANDNIIDSLMSLKSLRIASITVDEYMAETGLTDYFIAKDRLATSGLELHSFLMPFQCDEFEEIKLEPTDDNVEWNVSFLQNLTEDGQMYEDEGQLDLEFLPSFVNFLIKKYRDEKYNNLTAEEFTADMLLADLMELGLSYIKDYGFKLTNNIQDSPERMIHFIRNHYCLGPAPIMT